jgi:hypothetical protein
MLGSSDPLCPLRLCGEFCCRLKARVTTGSVFLRPLYARATLDTVSQVRVVTSFPNIRSIIVMKTGPLGVGK